MSYLTALIVVSAAAGLACLLVPDESSPGGRALRTFASLCVLSVALSPVWTAKDRVDALVASFEEFVESASGGADTSALADSAVARELSDAIASRVRTEFSLASDRVAVSVTLDTSNAAAPTLASARVSITGGDGSPDPDEVASFVRELTGAPCEAVILAP